MAIHIDESTFLSGANSAFVEELYLRYATDPSSVDESWRRFFDGLGDDARAILDEARGASWAPRRNGNGAAHPAPVEAKAPPTPVAQAPIAAAPAGPVDSETAHRDIRDSLRVLMLIRAYRVRGHHIANLDPLGLEGERHHPELDPASYGFTDADYDREFFIDGVLGRDRATLREILSILKQVYCGKIGVEFMHIQYPEEKSWIQQRLENTLNRTEFSRDEKLQILHQIDSGEGFERFLHVKYPGTKRFSLEGAESTIPALEAIIETGGRLGVEEIILGMPHRGRLNVLTSVMGKSYAAVFSEFQGEALNAEDVQGSGDVKYHLGTSADRELPDGRKIHLSLTANPSHLEAVNPVVLGKARAKQSMIGDADRTRVMGVLLHGDAAFAGQGLVAETLAMSELRGYRVGGTIHIIVNNQIGFTTSPNYSRSSPYPSDVAKMIQAPIFHVNGDDPEEVVHVARLATEFRQRFKRDVVIDIFCYRRHGHNEGDEPGFTQPLMYESIAKHPTTRQLYTERLVARGDLTPKEADKMFADFNERLENELEASKNYRQNRADWLQGKWAGFEVAPAGDRRGETAAPMEQLKDVGLAICKYPEGFNIHRRLARLLDAKRKTIETGKGIDWATGEALAFGTLMLEGKAVRLSGQDSGRGTFSQRHAVLIDQQTEERYMPLANLRDDQARFEVIDSPLIEAGVLGFEYGYSLADPNALVMWEAQFGDFANGAQVITDQFIAPGESKWLRMSGLVMMLPHGYEGQGPEHSSARLERWLQLYAEDNVQVANCTTPANFFHVLRRQMNRNFRKPLIMMTPKSLLRHKLAVSDLADMGPGTSFHRVLPESHSVAADDKITRVVLCTGKVYYDLLQERETRALDTVAIIRVEQLAPFPVVSLSEELARYPNAEVVWCQEEPKNMGAWTFVEPRIEEVLGNLDLAAKRPVYVGREAAASPATGFVKVHLREQAALVEAAIATEITAGGTRSIAVRPGTVAVAEG